MGAEMESPQHFPRCFIITMPLQVCLYLLVACWRYYFSGDKAKGYLLGNMHGGIAFQVASGILFMHVAIAFVIKNVVLSRYLHGLLSNRVGGSGIRARLEFATCSLGLLAASFLIANSIPFFSDFLGLIGGFLNGPVSFLLPITLFLGALRCTREDLLAEPSASSIWGYGRNTQDLQPLDMVLILLTMILILTTMVVGTYDVLTDIAKKISVYGAPFSCKALHS